MEKRIGYLIHLISENDDQLAFNELYRHYLPGLYSFACSILKNKENAEEIILDVFFKLWESRKTMKSIKKLSNYLYVATKHAAISHLRKKNIISYEEIGDDFAYTFITPEQQFITKENVHAVNSMINELPPRCKLIFRLIKEEKLSYEEVAALLNISKKTVESQMYIANKRLLDLFKAKFPEIWNYHISEKQKKSKSL